MPIQVRCDYRECRGSLYRALAERDDVRLEVTELDTGDFVVAERVTVERKTVTDLLGSLRTGRLFRQAAKLKSRAERPVLLVEGAGLGAIGSRRLPYVRGALASLSVMWYLPVLWAANREEAAELLVTIGRQWTRDRRETWAPPPGPATRRSDPRIVFMRCLPGVGPRIARRLLGQFGSVRDVCNARPADLASVRGIGRKRATAIVELLAGSAPLPGTTDRQHP